MLRDAGRLDAYAAHVVQALEHVMRTFREMHLGGLREQRLDCL